ncbi:MAG: hypothetical protein CV090_07390 [Nitrospira sp. WS238]|nr:hypothetical protein [Nitrospira sp. WS238]
MDWTIVKPLRLTNSPTPARVHADASLRIGLFSKVSRASLAAAILDEIQIGQFVKE